MTNKSGNVLVRLIIAGFLVVILITAIVAARSNSNPSSSASSPNMVEATMVPNQATLPVGVKIYINPNGQRVSEVKLVVDFNNQQLKLSGEPTFYPPFNPTKVTSIKEANNSQRQGRIHIIAKIDPYQTAVSNNALVVKLPFVARKSAGDFIPNGNNVWLSNTSNSPATPRSFATTKSGERLPIGQASTLLTTDEIDNARTKKPKDMGLVLTSQHEEYTDRDYLVAKWNNAVVDDMKNFETFQVVVRNPEAGTVSDFDKRNYPANENRHAFKDLERLQQGDYFVNLRAVFNNKIWVQTPAKFFHVGPKGEITIIAAPED